MSPDQKTRMSLMFEFLDQTLKPVVGGTPNYEALLKKTAQITQHCAQKQSKNGDEKATVVVQIKLIHKFLQRFWVSVCHTCQPDG